MFLMLPHSTHQQPKWDRKIHCSSLESFQEALDFMTYKERKLKSKAHSKRKQKDKIENTIVPISMVPTQCRDTSSRQAGYEIVSHQVVCLGFHSCALVTAGHQKTDILQILILFLLYIFVYTKNRKRKYQIYVTFKRLLYCFIHCLISNARASSLLFLIANIYP